MSNHINGLTVHQNIYGVPVACLQHQKDSTTVLFINEDITLDVHSNTWVSKAAYVAFSVRRLSDEKFEQTLASLLAAAENLDQ